MGAARIAVGALCLLGGAGCRSGSATPATTTPVAAFVTQYCALLEPCCEAAGLSTSGQACPAFATTATSSSYDPSSGSACLAGMQQESSGGTLCATLGTDLAPCTSILSPVQGTAQPGQPCAQDSDCASADDGGAACYAAALDGGAAASMCIRTLPGQPGDTPCAGTRVGASTTYDWAADAALPAQVYICNAAAGAGCDEDSGTCVALAAVGAPCAQDDACVASAYCDTDADAGQCAPRLPNGAPCAGSFSGCAAGSTCDPASMTCQPQLAVGSPCAAPGDCASGDCASQVCTAEGRPGLLLQVCGTD